MEINIRNKNSYSGEGEYVGRPTALGNPFKITETQPRNLSIQRYSLWLKDAINHNDPSVLKFLQYLFDTLVSQNKLVLICWCVPEQCHAEVIKEVLLNKYYTGEWLIDGEIYVEKT